MTVKLEPITVQEIEGRLGEFEARFNLPSDQFALAFTNGHLDETEEFVEWSMLYSALRIAQRRGKP